MHLIPICPDPIHSIIGLSHFAQQLITYQVNGPPWAHTYNYSKKKFEWTGGRYSTSTRQRVIQEFCGNYCQKPKRNYYYYYYPRHFPFRKLLHMKNPPPPQPALIFPLPPFFLGPFPPHPHIHTHTQGDQKKTKKKNMGFAGGVLDHLKLGIWKIIWDFGPYIWYEEDKILFE